MTNPINLNQIIYQAPTVGQIAAAAMQAPTIANAQGQKQQAMEMDKSLALVAALEKSEASGDLKNKAKDKQQDRSGRGSKEEPSFKIDTIV